MLIDVFTVLLVKNIGTKKITKINDIIRYQSRDVTYPVLKGRGFAKRCPLKQEM